MRRSGSWWHVLIAWSNLVLAAKNARRRKRARPVVQRFEFRREHELYSLQQELISGIYTPGEYVTHWIHEPKRRLISAAPYRDRVLHHAVMNVLEPILDRRFHPLRGIFLRSTVGTVDSRRANQHDRRRGERRVEGIHCRSRLSIAG